MSKTDKKRHRTGPTAAARLLSRITEPAFRRHGFATTEVLLRWPAIVGAELAAIATPEKLSFPRNSPAGGTLHVRVAGAVATELQHRAPQIIERVNTYYGYRAVARLHLVQAPPKPKIDSQPVRNRTKLTPEQTTKIGETISTVRDPRLRAALERMRTHMSDDGTTPN
jgi:hypothetical protein